MVVNSDTLWIAFAPFEKYLQAGERERLQKAAPLAVIGSDGYLSLTIADFNRVAMHGDWRSLVSSKEEYEMTVFEFYTIAGLKDFFEGYARDLERFTMKPDTKEKKAQSACYKVGAVESMLVFAREYFGLHSFHEAERVTLADLLVARKDAYNKAAFQKAYQAQFNSKKK